MTAHFRFAQSLSMLRLVHIALGVVRSDALNTALALPPRTPIVWTGD
jgi:hypothetical protein